MAHASRCWSYLDTLQGYRASSTARGLQVVFIGIINVLVLVVALSFASATESLVRDQAGYGFEVNEKLVPKGHEFEDKGNFRRLNQLAVH
jgi:hypothetical protein